MKEDIGLARWLGLRDCGGLAEGVWIARSRWACEMALSLRDGVGR